MIFESLTGNTAKAGRAIADQLTEAGIPTVASPITAIDLEALSGPIWSSSVPGSTASSSPDSARAVRDG
ncbi:MAG: hypothetical protein R2710_20355 [Acidimicrobiales bacterium]